MHLKNSLGTLAWLAFFSLCVSACRQFEVSIPVPSQNERVASAISVSHEEGFDIEIYFPDGRRVEDPSEMPITFTRIENSKPAIAGPFWLTLSTKADDPIRVALATYHPYKNAKVEENKAYLGLLKIFLSRNRLALPVYKADSTQTFVPNDLLLSIGRVVKQEKNILGMVKSSHYCNSVLVGDRYALTNNHCIADQTECDQSHFIFVTKETGLARSCNNLIHTEPLYDQSLVELNEQVTSPFKPVPTIDSDYFFRNETPVFVASTFGFWESSWFAQTWKIPADSAEKASAIVTGCAVISSSEFTFADAPTDLHLSNYSLSCKAINGQSGSAVVGSDGKLVGLLWGRDANESNGEFIPLHPNIRAEIAKRVK